MVLVKSSNVFLDLIVFAHFSDTQKVGRQEYIADTGKYGLPLFGIFEKS